MDVSAIVRATETDLRDMGLQETGDIMCSKIYIKKESGNNCEKEELRRKIRETAAERCREFTPKRNKCKETKNVKAQESRLNHTKQSTLGGCMQLKPSIDTNQLDWRIVVVFVT